MEITPFLSGNQSEVFVKITGEKLLLTFIFSIHVIRVFLVKEVV